MRESVEMKPEANKPEGERKASKEQESRVKSKTDGLLSKKLKERVALALILAFLPSAVIFREVFWA